MKTSERMIFEERKAKGVALSRQISTILKRAGVPKKGRYSAYQRHAPGFYVAEIGNGTRPTPTVVAAYSEQRGACEPSGDAMCWLAMMHEIIVDDGRFAVEVWGRYSDALLVTRYETR